MNTFDNNNENFEELLEKSFSEISSYEPGELVETKVVSVTNECVFLDLGGKSEGVLDASELTDKDGNISVKAGDTIKAYFLNVQSGEFLFTTKIAGEKAGDALLEKAFQNSIPVEGSVEKEIKGGFEIKIGNSRAFCPYSQMGLKRIENPQEYVGRTLAFLIREYKNKGRNIIVSNRVLLQEKKDEQKEELKKKLSENMKVKGIVKSIRKFGAFVDIGGIQALLPVSEISRSRISNVSDVLKEGQEIEAVILSIDWNRDRISVSMKELEADPWDGVEKKYPVGTKLTGEIVRLTNFGAFVNLEPGIDGLIHVSDLEGGERINHPRDVVKQGQKIEIQIAGVDGQNKRISLKPAAKAPEHEKFAEYMDTDSDTDNYNPFGDLLKGK